MEDNSTSESLNAPQDEFHSPAYFEALKQGFHAVEEYAEQFLASKRSNGTEEDVYKAIYEISGIYWMQEKRQEFTEACEELLTLTAPNAQLPLYRAGFAWEWLDASLALRFIDAGYLAFERDVIKSGIILSFPFYRNLKKLELAIRVSQESDSKEVDRLMGELVLLGSKGERHLLPALEQLADASDSDVLRKHLLRQLLSEEWAYRAMKVKLGDDTHLPYLEQAERLLLTVSKVTGEELIAFGKERRSEAERA